LTDGPFLRVGEAIRQGTELMAAAGVPEPRLTAEVLLAHAMHRDRTYFFAHPEQRLQETEWIHYGRYLHERAAGKPTQYITHKQEFFGREFRVTQDVLIPRPETELLVEAVLGARPAPGRVVDVGTGSGCIAVSLALAGAAPVGVDISNKALDIAVTNAERLKAGVDFVCGDLLQSFADDSFEIVVSNPPYVPVSEKGGLQREVREWEPETALFAGEDGLQVYRRLIPQAARALRPGGLIALEVGFGLAGAVNAMLADWGECRILPDYAGIPRVALAQRPC
jgi:release factor glutamine methyltransferase